MDGDDAPGDLAVVIDDRGSAEADPCAGAVAVLVENFLRWRGFAVQDSAGEWILFGFQESAVGTAGP